jgi:hypothetical protein
LFVCFVCLCAAGLSYLLQEGAEELEQQPGWYPGSVGFHLDTGKVWDGKVNNQSNQTKPTEID